MKNPIHWLFLFLFPFWPWDLIKIEVWLLSQPDISDWPQEIYTWIRFIENVLSAQLNGLISFCLGYFIFFNLKSSHCMQKLYFCRIETIHKMYLLNIKVFRKHLPNNSKRTRIGQLFLWCTRQCTAQWLWFLTTSLIYRIKGSKTFTQLSIQSNENEHVNSSCRLKYARTHVWNMHWKIDPPSGKNESKSCSILLWLRI